MSLPKHGKGDTDKYVKLVNSILSKNALRNLKTATDKKGNLYIATIDDLNYNCDYLSKTSLWKG